METVAPANKPRRNPGRPHAIPSELHLTVANLYDQGHGYRAIVRILRQDYSCSPDYSSVRRLLIKLNKVIAMNRGAA